MPSPTLSENLSESLSNTSLPQNELFRNNLSKQSLWNLLSRKLSLTISPETSSFFPLRSLYLGNTECTCSTIYLVLLVEPLPPVTQRVRVCMANTNASTVPSSCKDTRMNGEGTCRLVLTCRLKGIELRVKLKSNHKKRR